jgi:hypothetical protein
VSITRAVVGLTLDVTETIGTDAAGYVASNSNSVKFNGGDVDETLTASTTPDVTGQGVGIVTLSSGSGTLDLTSLTGVNGAAVSLSGKKPRAILFENPDTNANAITIAKGGSNGYTGLGSAFSLTLQPGQKALVWLNTAGTAVSGSVKVFDISGTGAQVLKYQMVGGT